MLLADFIILADLRLEGEGKLSYIHFSTYEWTKLSSEHGALKEGKTECDCYSKLPDGHPRDKVSSLRKLVHKTTPYSCFLTTTI